MNIYKPIFQAKKKIILGFLIILGLLILIPFLCSLTCLSFPIEEWNQYCKNRPKDMLCFSNIVQLKYEKGCLKDCLWHPLQGISQWLAKFK